MFTRKPRQVKPTHKESVARALVAYEEAYELKAEAYKRLQTATGAEAAEAAVVDADFLFQTAADALASAIKLEKEEYASKAKVAAKAAKAAAAGAVGAGALLVGGLAAVALAGPPIAPVAAVVAAGACVAAVSLAAVSLVAVAVCKRRNLRLKQALHNKCLNASVRVDV